MTDRQVRALTKTQLFELLRQQEAEIAARDAQIQALQAQLKKAEQTAELLEDLRRDIASLRRSSDMYMYATMHGGMPRGR